MYYVPFYSYSHMLQPVLPSYKADRLGRHLWNEKSKLKCSSVIKLSDWQLAGLFSCIANHYFGVLEV